MHLKGKSCIDGVEFKFLVIMSYTLKLIKNKLKSTLKMCPFALFIYKSQDYAPVNI